MINLRYLVPICLAATLGGLLFGFDTGVMAATPAAAREIHVSVAGSDANDGSAGKPYRTISAAAQAAWPGDVITVHAGVYRERVSPPRGGLSDSERIVYRAAPGERVEITGSEPIKDWVRVQNDTWKVVLPNSFFGRFNPYRDLIHGDWFKPEGWNYHTGAVYLDGRWLPEAATRDEVLKPAGAVPLWFGEVDGEKTVIWAQFRGVNPNRRQVEVNVRQTVFYPEKPGINYLTVRGFILEQAATPWAPPTAEQIGLIGTHWSKGWIIEDNVIRDSICVGLTLGKYGDEWDNRSASSAGGYVETIKRALTHGWSKDAVGHHLVRNNDISDCGQAGIAGSLGAIFSTVTGNSIHDIHTREHFAGFEMAGIKFHGAIDVQINGNQVYRCQTDGIWLDWMAQGARVSGNLLHDNLGSDLFFEVDHGPILVDDNLLLSGRSLHSRSSGIAFVHNLFGGTLLVHPYDPRQTPFFLPHSTVLAGFHDNPQGDDRYYNNLFAGAADLRQYDQARLPVWMSGNVFLGGSKPSRWETAPLVQPRFDPALKLIRKADGTYLAMNYDAAWNTGRTRPLVTTALLGRALIPKAAYEQPDGSALVVDTDYFGKARPAANPSAGPFERPGEGAITLKIWAAAR